MLTAGFIDALVIRVLLQPCSAHGKHRRSGRTVRSSRTLNGRRHRAYRNILQVAHWMESAADRTVCSPNLSRRDASSPGLIGPFVAGGNSPKTLYSCSGDAVAQTARHSYTCRDAGEYHVPLWQPSRIVRCRSRWPWANQNRGGTSGLGEFDCCLHKRLMEDVRKELVAETCADGDTDTASCAAAGKNGGAALGLHASPESVHLYTTATVGLKCALRHRTALLNPVEYCCLGGKF